VLPQRWRPHHYRRRQGQPGRAGLDREGGGTAAECLSVTHAHDDDMDLPSTATASHRTADAKQLCADIITAYHAMFQHT